MIPNHEATGSNPVGITSFRCYLSVRNSLSILSTYTCLAQLILLAVSLCMSLVMTKNMLSLLRHLLF
jgi:hypothetical protein